MKINISLAILIIWTLICSCNDHQPNAVNYAEKDSSKFKSDKTFWAESIDTTLCFQSNIKILKTDLNSILEKHKLVSIKELNKTCTNYTLGFINNPYKFNSNDKVVFVVNHYVLYNGKFYEGISLDLPNELIETMVSIKLFVSKKDVIYEFSTESSLRLEFVRKNSNLIHFVFIPDNIDWGTFYTNFTNSKDYDG
jgi:hypothetical protein